LSVATSSIDKTLVALADPTRRGVIDLLRTGPRRAGELAEALDMAELRREPFNGLRGWLDEVEAFWSLQLDGFKEHAERTRGKKRARKAS
jgi:DNA-binding transcriptional ArsR family regulator